MAEAVGLSLAILGLAGNLKGCLDMFAYFSSARDFGRDYSTLASKFDIEKALLLQWAERVRILQPDYDPRLNDQTTMELVSGILANIKRLLDDGAVLQRKYGLKSVKVSPDRPQGLLGDAGGSTKGPPEDGLISNSMMRSFTKDFQSLCIRTKISQSTTSTKQKFLWVVGHKEKFEKLVNDLAHFVSKLNQIVPDCGGPSSLGELGDGLIQKIYQLMTESSRRAFHMAAAPEDTPRNSSPRVAELAQLRMARDAARQDQPAGILSDVADKILIQKSESMIIEAIWFRSLQARRDSIEPAHLKTLAWVLESVQDTGEWDNLATWLKFESGVYWVSGKAGSGKSTLMKHVHDHLTTLDLLEQWASGDSLFVGSFFFWGLGSTEQKSHRGLSRSLLYHITERYPFLVPKLFPAIWREVYVKNERNLQNLAPTDVDLKGAFTTLPTIIAEYGIKICLFIDGLDEYEGNLRDATQMILKLGQTPNIKLVVSSRPEPACVSAFSTLKKLRLQDLNRPDIQEYANSTIGAHPYLQVLQKHDDAACAQLLEDLANRASGVFLWIVLACRSLLDGFESTDRLCELRERLEELPRELAEMFQHMLKKVPTKYREQTAKLLKLAERCQVAPWHTDDPHHYGMPALTLSIMERVDFHPESTRFDHMDMAERLVACEEIEGRVRSRTGGLLEFSYTPVAPIFCAQHELGTDPVGFGKLPVSKMNSVVRFMHRTVYDFLHDSTVWQSLDALQLANTSGFDPESVLAAMALARVHFTYMYRGAHGGRIAAAQSLSFFRNIDELSFTQATARNADRLFSLAKQWARADQHNFSSVSLYRQLEPSSQISFAAEVGMTHFLECNLHNQDWSSVQQGDDVRPSLLHYALIQPLVTRFSTGTPLQTWVPPLATTVSYLLKQGYHPMEQVATKFLDSKTIWKAWLDRLAERADIRASKDSWEITMKMMDYGADPRIMREHKSTVASSIFDLLVQYEDDYTGEQDSDECHRLRELLDEWRLGGCSDTSEGEESMSGLDSEEWEDQDRGSTKRPRSEDESDGPDSKRRRYSDDEDENGEGEDDDEYDYTNRQNIDDDDIGGWV